VVERAEIESKKDNFDQVWVVFDKDDFPADNFDNAISKAESLGFQVAFSNQAFEYWLILHFENHQGGAMHRNDYDAKINQHLLPFEIKYDGENSKIVEEQFFDIMNAIDAKTGEKRVNLAIKRAKSIYENIETTSFAAAESSTTVFKLVEELIRYF
jgi:RloB-like protein